VARKNIIKAIVNYPRDSPIHAQKSCERTLFDGERAIFVRIVAFRLVFAGPFDMLHRMDQVPVRDHGMVGGFFKLSSPVVLGGGPLVLCRMLQKFGGFQMMIDALLRHVFRITKRNCQLGKGIGASNPGGVQS